MQPRLPGIVALTAFFGIASLVSVVSLASLLFPGGAVQGIWRVNPRAQVNFEMMGSWAIVLLAVVAAACLATAFGLWARTNWGRHLALAVLLASLVGDISNLLVRGDARTLVGIPIAGVMIGYLMTDRVRQQFSSGSSST
jgi:hypothetical protein